MEYKSFEEFYNKAYNLAEQAKSKNLNAKLSVIYARKIFSKTDLNKFYNVGILKKNKQYYFKQNVLV